MKSIEANKVIKTLYWISRVSSEYKPELETHKNKDGVYECMVYLPIIEKNVIGLGKSKIESIDNASNKSSDLIDEYLKNHPDIQFQEDQINSGCFLEEDDLGNLCFHLVKKGGKT